MAQSFSTIATTPIIGRERSPLENAVESNDLDRVQFLIKREESNGDLEAFKLLLTRALTLVQSKEVGDLLIDNGANVKAKGEGGSTVLMETNLQPAVEWLVAHPEVELEQQDDRGRTALRRTVQKDDGEAKAICLIDGGASINASDHEGRTVLMTAVWKSRTGVIDKLLSQKDPQTEVEINKVDEKGRTALHHLASDRERTYDYQDSPEPNDQQSKDQGILETLLSAGHESGAKDNRGLTCLHWTAATGCSGLLKVFLMSEKFNVNVDEENYDGWTSLQIACEAPSDVSKSVEILLHHAADPNKKTKNGRTPLHLAAAAGNLEIVRTLLNHKDIERNARDMFGNTALLSAGSLDPAHPKRTAIVELFSPWREIHAPSRSENAEQAAKLWMATIVDFRPKKDDGHNARGTASEPKDKDKVAEPRPKIVQSEKQAAGTKHLSQTSVFELLYGRDSEDHDKPTQTVSPTDLGRDGFRWIHLPANNVAWCQDLLSKYYVEDDTMDVNSFKSLERSFNQQRGGDEPQSRYMSSTCQPVLRPWGNEEGDLTRGDSAEVISRPGSMANPRHKASSSSEPRENIDNENSKAVQFWEPARIVDSPKGSYDDGQPPMKSQRKDDDGSISDFYVFMPYLHFETVQNHQDMCKFADHFTGKKPLHPREFANPGPNEKDVALYRAHLNSPEHSLHVRRTLDQSFYHHINTEVRDRDQVIHRFQKQFRPQDDPKILMVDQLWMWVIGQNLIVTSFSPRWAQPKKDPLDLLEYVKSIIELGTREPIRDVYELAMIISGRCYGAYDRHGVGSEDPHFLDMFEGWIGAAMNDEVEVFKFFKQDSARASDWLRNPHSLREVKRRQERLRKKMNQLETIRTTNFKVIHTPQPKYPSTDESFVENLLDIGWETTLLEEVKDIRDELGMLTMVFDRQEYVWESIKDTIDTISSQKEWSSGAQKKFKRAFEDHKKMISQPRKDTERMKSQAKGVYDSVRDLLDLKQKHANAIEARYAREQTDDSSRQGKTLTVFTTVTTIFLPISFIAAFFAINIGELPHDEQDVQVLSLGFVSKYTFGVGLSIALLCVIVALKVEDFMCWIRDMQEKEGHPPANRVHESATKNKPNNGAAPERHNAQPVPQPAARATARHTLTDALRLRLPRREPRKHEDEENGNVMNGNI